MIYILYGEDQERSQYKLERIKETAQYDVLERYDMNEVSEETILEAVGTTSLFAESSLVIIDNASFLGRKTPSKKSKRANGDVEEEAEDSEEVQEIPAGRGSKKAGKSKSGKKGMSLAEKLAALDPEDKTVVFMVPSKSLLPSVKKLFPKAVYTESKVLDEKSIEPAVREMLKEKKISMDKDALAWFCANAGLNTLRISSELDKLKLYSDHITLEDAKALTTVEPEQSVFKMSDALFQKNGPELLQYYRSFRQQGMEPIAVVALLASQIRFVYQVRVMMDLHYDQQKMADTLHVKPGRIYYTQKNARRFTASQLLENLAMLADLDYRMKSGQVDKDTGFENFVLHMMLEQKNIHTKI